MNDRKCLYCYRPLDSKPDFHRSCSTEFFGAPDPPLLPYSIDQMAEMAKKVVEQNISVPGVQAKLSMSLFDEVKDDPRMRLTVTGAMGGNFIFKPPSAHYPEMPQNEHVTMRIAEAFGIRVVPSSLIRLSSGEISYITKRIDRGENGRKIHMLDMLQITGASDKYRSSMERVGMALDAYSENTLLDKIFLFELTLFSFLTGNNDMHLKNFSMIRDRPGWVLSPAYDLLNVAVLLPGDKEELALTLAGRKKKLTKRNFTAFGRGLGLTEKQSEAAFGRMVRNRPQAGRWIDSSFLSDEMKTAYKATLDSGYSQLNLS